jgi:hypothetical protein
VLPKPKAGNTKSFGIVCSFFPSKLRTSQLVVCFWCPFSLTYIVANYGRCCSCCNYNTRVEKLKEAATTQEHKKPTSKRNLRNSKLKKNCCF